MLVVQVTPVSPARQRPRPGGGGGGRRLRRGGLRRRRAAGVVEPRPADLRLDHDRPGAAPARRTSIEVAISGMLVLGVGSLGAECRRLAADRRDAGGRRRRYRGEPAVPPKVATADAGRAIDGLADALSDLLHRAADGLTEAGRRRPRRWRRRPGLARRGPPHHPRHPRGRRRPAPRGAGPAAQRPRRRNGRRGTGAASGPRGARALGSLDPGDVPRAGGRDARRRDLARRRDRRRRAPRARADVPGDGRRASTRSGSWSATRPTPRTA